MSTTLPSRTETLDTIFLSTWYNIRAQAVDNILDANVVTALFRRMGVFEEQVGERLITRTIRYGQKTGTTVQKGDVLPHGETELETMAVWNWKYIVSHAQRSLQDDQQNTGPHKIADLVQKKLGAARDATDRKLETSILAAPATSEGTDLRATRDLDGLYNILPGSSYVGAAVGTYTYGGIDTNNSWWQAQYKTATADPEINLISDMRNLYNTCGANKSFPNVIITDQETFELYEDFALGKTQIVKDAGTMVADLGYEVLRFKGKPLVWTADFINPGDTDKHGMAFLNTEFLSFVYDPNMFFEMTAWRTPPYQLERIAYIVTTGNLVCDQLRRQGLLEDIDF